MPDVDKGLYCTECFNWTPDFYKVVYNEEEKGFGLCYRCAHDILISLPIDAEIVKEG
jgi:hypothetical protein